MTDADDEALDEEREASEAAWMPPNPKMRKNAVPINSRMAARQSSLKLANREPNDRIGAEMNFRKLSGAAPLQIELWCISLWSRIMFRTG